VRRTSGRMRRLGLVLAAASAVAACSNPPAAPPTTAPGPTSGAATAIPGPTVTEPTPSPSAAPCSAGWGSEPKTVAEPGRATLVAVRTSNDECADRVEFELAGPAVGYAVSYVEQVTQDGSGEVVTVPGGARLQVQLNHPAYDDAGQATYSGVVGRPLSSVSGYRTLQSVVFAGSFEGYSTFGVGVRARLPFRVTIVDGAQPRSRIVLEIAHTWT
jgi:hypothetical protein